MTARTTPVPYALPADEERDGWPQWLLTTDHKRIGILTIGTALILFFFNGAIALTSWPSRARTSCPRSPTCSS
jgi:hypothetical protein